VETPTGILNDRDSLRWANERFYHALEGFDLAAMDALWVQEPWVQCIHPGWEALVGWPAVRQSFEEIFASTRWLRVTPTAAREVLIGDLAIVSCAENITLGGGDDVGLAVAHATNIFRRTPSGWRMVHHHASAAPVRVTQPFSGTVQ
jgi:ketosteroid isomerase-like protein